MIRVTLYYKKDCTLYGYRIEGHADAAPYGEDLVCAAVSMLGITVGNSLEAQAVPCQGRQAHGFMKLILVEPMSNELACVAQAVLKTFEIGIKQLEERYPTYIKANSVFV